MRSSAINILSALKDAIISSHGIRTSRIRRGVRGNGCSNDSVGIGCASTITDHRNEDAIGNVARGEEADQQGISCLGRRGIQVVDPR